MAAEMAPYAYYSVRYNAGRFLTAAEMTTGAPGGALLALFGPIYPLGRGPRPPPSTAGGADLEHDNSTAAACEELQSFARGCLRHHAM